MILYKKDLTFKSYRCNIIKITSVRFNYTINKGGINLKQRLFNVIIFLLTVLFVNNVAFANEFSQKTKQEMDLKQYFGDVNGCAVFYSNKKDIYYVYNSDLLEVREIPCSTFKVILALAGLENKVIQDEHTVLRWDGIERNFPQWNQDLSMMSAIQLSATWYFNEVAEKVGTKKIAALVKEMEYGNMDSSGETLFWESSLKISPMEQIDFIRKLFCNELPFQQKNLDIVKKAMYLNTEKGKLYGKTGTSGIRLENGNQTAWFVGDYKTNSDEYYFAVRIYGDKDRKDIAGKTAQTIAQNILKDKFAK